MAENHRLTPSDWQLFRMLLYGCRDSSSHNSVASYELVTKDDIRMIITFLPALK